MLVLFVVVERARVHPMLPLDLFHSRAFAGANLLTFCLYAALTCTMFFLSFDLIQAQGFSPAAAGASMADLVKVTIFYAEVADFARLNEVYARHMPDPPPARSAPANVKLPRGLLISIDAIAVIPAQAG